MRQAEVTAQAATTTRGARRGVRVLAAGLALAATAALAGCGAIRPQLANPNYGASDGVRMTMGQAATGENLLILSPAKGGPGILTGALSNTGTSPVTITIAIPGATAPFATQRVDAGQTLLLGTGEDMTKIAIPAVPAAPGAVQEIAFETPAYGSVQVPVPVLDGTFAEYATEVPTPTPTAMDAAAS